MDRNKAYVKAQDQLDSLLADYNALVHRSKYDDLSDLEPESRILAAQLQAALDRLTAAGDTYNRAAEALRSKPTNVKVVELAALAQALLNDLEEGWWETVTEMIHGDTFADFLETATELQRNGYKDAAAVVAGTALEVHLRSLAMKHGVNVNNTGGKPKKADTLNSDLKKISIYGGTEQKQVTAWLGLRNDAAHGNYTEYSSDQIRRLIEDVESFIARHVA